MLVPGTWTWPEAIPVMAVAIALLFVPGLGIALLVRARVGLAFALAPAMSTGLIAAGGIVCGALGVSWSIPTALITVLTGWGLAGAGAFAVSRCWPRRITGKSRALDDESCALGWSGGRVAQTLGTLSGTAFAAFFFAWLYVRSSKSPEAFPQQPDTILHLALPQWMLEHGDISFFHALSFTTGQERGKYPVGFHDMTATLSLLTGAPVLISTSAFVVVVAGIVWPLGMAVLAREILGTRPEVGAIGAATSVFFNAYPFLQVALGVLWPNFYGQAVMPGVLAVTAVAVRELFTAGGRRRAAQAILLVAFASPGLALAHFNSWVSYLVFAWLVLVVAAGQRVRRPGTTWARWGPLLLTLVVAMLGALVSLKVAPQGMLNTGVPGPEKDMLGGLADTLLFSPHGTESLTVLSILILIGAVYVVWRQRAAVWLVLGCAVFMALYFVSVTIDSPLTRHFTWPWYNISHRLSAIVILPAAILVTAALLGLATLMGRLVPGTWNRNPHIVRTASAAVLTAALIVGTGGYRHTKFDKMDDQFFPKSELSWASPAELRSLQALARRVPEGAVVAADPWNGATYMYVVSGRRLLWPTEKTNNNADRQLLGLKLNTIGKDPAVCAAAQRQGVEYAITGGQFFAWAEPEDLQQYVGVNKVATSPAWEPIATEKPYTLYRLTHCAS